MIQNNSIIIVTGAAGFIGSCMVEFLNKNGYNNLLLVDDFEINFKINNWANKHFLQSIHRKDLEIWMQKNSIKIDCFIHLGARTDTTEFDYSIHQKLNVDYSKMVWQFCQQNNVPLIYASSAATYGNGNLGYNDDHETPFTLQPLNPYGISKNEFDKWAIEQANQPVFWAGLKFFNVYGPNEYHKNRMASVVWHAFNQIKNDGFVKLFKSHKTGFNDGQQLRDFIYVKDVVQVIFWMMQEAINRTTQINNGLYNLGTGNAQPFELLANATFEGLQLAPKIEYIDMPLDIRDTYQYYTQANMAKLFAAGYTQKFWSLQEGVIDYVTNYLTSLKTY
jgi:ADP-L-glycero-D-manno-heptose 6-epimerase